MSEIEKSKRTLRKIMFCATGVMMPPRKKYLLWQQRWGEQMPLSLLLNMAALKAIIWQKRGREWKVMDESHKKARTTRERNQKVRSKLYQEQAQSVRTARAALTKVLKDERTTPAEILEAARLLVEIGK